MEDLIMRRIYLLLLIAGIISPAMRGQESAQEQYRRAFLLEQQGHFDPAILGFKALVESDTLTLEEKGRAWTLLGYAYREKGRYQESQNAYEQALRIFAGDAQHRGDYANALDCFAGLSRSTGQSQAASRMWSQALDIYKQQNDHRGIARTYANLAGLAMEQNHVRPARSAIEKAIAETKMAKDFSDDDLALICETQAWVTGAEGDHRSAIAGYQHTLELRRHSHGEYFALTGWSYLILGRAYAGIGQTNEALINMREGLKILEQTEGRNTPRYLSGEILYSQALDQLGSHEEASHLRDSARKSLSDLYRSQCVGCTLSASSFR
jgi:tetratricopeptide (TPR) repeat protein